MEKKASNKRYLALGLIIAFLSGWLFFSYYLYTNQILIVDIQGVITDFHETTLALYRGKVDRNVKAVILYLNTPGGLAYPCLEIASYVKELARVKPVIAVMGAECASGGYYIASFATHIYVRENTITGGIGVISVWVDLSEYYKKQGIKLWIWKKGEEKDVGAEWRSPTEEENATIQAAVDALFTKIVNDIKANRDLSDSELDRISSGAIFLGSEAMDLGLADEVGNIIDAQWKAVEMAGLWRYIIVLRGMSEIQKFLKAMF